MDRVRSSFLRRHAPTPLLCLLLIGLTAAAYANACRNDFVNYDDDHYVTANPHVLTGLTAENVRWAWTTTEMVNWHPLTWLSFQADAQRYYLNPAGFHLTNVLLHIADAVLLFLALRRLTAAPGRSFFVAALFALHPLHVESVAWISERKDVLSVFFGLLALLAYAWYAERPGLGRYLLVALGLVLSLLAKPMLVTLPALLLLLDYWPLRRFRGLAPAEAPAVPAASWWWLVVEKLPLLLPVAGSAVITMIAQQQGGANNPVGQLPLRLENAALSYVIYLRETFWPVHLVLFVPYPTNLFPVWQVVGAAGVLVAVTALALLARRRCPYLAVGWLWFLGTLLPVIGVVQVLGGHALADRYTYFPLIGIFLMIVWGGADLAAWVRLPRAVPVLAGALVLIPCLVLTRIQVGYWHDSFVLWQHTLAFVPDNYLAHTNLGVAYLNAGEVDRAIPEIEAALRERPSFDLAYYNLGLCLARRGQVEQAAYNFRMALWISPRYEYARYYSGWAFEREGKLPEAAHEYEALTALAPSSAGAHAALAGVLLAEGKAPEAARQYEEAAQIDPGQAAYRSGMASALLWQGKVDEAVPQAEAARRLDAHDGEAAYALGVVAAVRGKRGEALAHFQEAVTAQANFGRYAYALAHSLQGDGQAALAVAWYQYAWRLDATWPDSASRRA
ncbi:MAG TPA: tetratricopeptide repeat protein, partial [Gemmataceae bacterium]|nr:tetratricopeptide repeat protein [Gemmataceae bacterium]